MPRSRTSFRATRPRGPEGPPGGRPEGFATDEGTGFRFIAKPKPGWSGIVDCVVLEADEPRLLRCSWTDHGGGETTEVAYRIEPHAAGTRFTYDHTGFTGTGGFFVAQILGHVRRKMLRVGLSAVLNELDEMGDLRPGSTLKPKI
ncbi:SRPBCC family protein [Streptomyces rhizosphaerihabitans]|uniref:SRPBCC family protein n=1 Tax=Streptomyces rhizosphaerihabitans TaxID=1266770 RepID=UPI0021C102E5|nr:SRPBCC domain-containing protein [Streptomyces rhizosphaerihabitans]MCT9007776.1 SRPBCC domain-containing protein [Streptomyces rhizosphaerihabitans]